MITHRGDVALLKLPIPAADLMATIGVMTKLYGPNLRMRENPEGWMQFSVPAAPPAECSWRPDEGGVYTTECGHMFTFTDGTPADNGATYCQYCGKKIKEEAAS